MSAALWTRIPVSGYWPDLTGSIRGLTGRAGQSKRAGQLPDCGKRLFQRAPLRPVSPADPGGSIRAVGA